MNLRFFNPAGPDRVAVAETLASDVRPGQVSVQVRRGPTAAKMTRVTVAGIFPPEEAVSRFRGVVGALGQEGFRPSGMRDLLADLQAKTSVRRGRSARRLGRLADRLTRRLGPGTALVGEIVDGLLAALPAAVDDSCAILDALGAAGDPRAVPALRSYAERKLLSRRRSAAEALMRLGDAGGVAGVRARAIERLPAGMKVAGARAAEAKETDEAAAGTLVSALAGLDWHEQGPALDSLYELATPTAAEAVRRFLPEARFDRPGIWRGLKSVLKRAALRRDHVTFGLLSALVELRGRQTKGFAAKLKSGYDGVERDTRLFGRGTQDWCRRAAWRHLQALAADRPEEYAPAAAECLLHHGPEDLAEPAGLAGRFARSWVVAHVLFAGGKRFAFDSRRTRALSASAELAGDGPDGVREEAFPDLWDLRPGSYLRVLSAARLPEVHAFAHRAVAGRFRDLLHAADEAIVLAMVAAPFEPTAVLGLEELRRRMDPARPDWAVLERVLADARPTVRQVGLEWLAAFAPAWVGEPARAIGFLTAADPEVRVAAATAVLARLAVTRAPAAGLAAAIRTLLSAPEPGPGVHEAAARVAREGVAAELAALFTPAELLGILDPGAAATASPSARAVAAEMIDRRPEIADQFGLDGVAALAVNPMAAVRSVALRLLGRFAARLAEDPSPLFRIGESPWPDARAAAAGLIRSLSDPARLGLPGLVGLLDAGSVEIRSAGRDLVVAHRAALDIGELVLRLIESPAADVREFALELMRTEPACVPRLDRLAGFFRRVMMELWPSRRAKRAVLDVALQRGLADAAGAAAAIPLLESALTLRNREDFESALQGLVRLRLAFPQVAATVAVPAALVQAPVSDPSKGASAKPDFGKGARPC